MLMILARLVRSESFWAVVKVRSPHTGPGIRYIILLETFKVREDFVLARKEIKFSGVSMLTCAANAGLSKMLSECKSRSPDTWNSCTVSGAPGDC